MRIFTASAMSAEGLARASHPNNLAVILACALAAGCNKTPTPAPDANTTPAPQSVTSAAAPTVEAPSMATSNTCQPAPAPAKDAKPEAIVAAFYEDCLSTIDSRFFDEEIVAMAEKVREKYKDADGPCYTANNSDLRYVAQDVEISDFKVGPFDPERSTVMVQFKNTANHDVDQVFFYHVKMASNGWRIDDIVFPETRGVAPLREWLTGDLEGDDGC